MTPIIMLPEAEEDILRIRLHYEAISVPLSEKFLARLIAIFGRLERHPRLYGRIFRNARAARVRGFPHMVYHYAYADKVEIFCVAHGAARKSVWRSRM